MLRDSVGQLAGQPVPHLSRTAVYGKTIHEGCYGTARDSLRDTLSRACPAQPFMAKRSMRDAMGQWGTACGRPCPAPVPHGQLSQKQHAGHLTPFGLYNTNNGEGWDRAASRSSIVCQRVVQTVCEVASLSRASHKKGCTKECNRAGVTSGEGKSKTCAFFFLRGPSVRFQGIHFTEKRLLEDMNRMRLSILAFARYVSPVRSKSNQSTSIAFVVEASAHNDQFHCQMYHQNDSPQRKKTTQVFDFLRDSLSRTTFFTKRIL